ncbi:PREDICTED: uncharacterized protein LOC105567491 [Vollenhovia emeryi]|uniref:uncharacterized protein LOC105567491 n=1 Tax=Vollenhovia emeryi TaxID=411798 RepID=UPI0005F57AEE|nr:PREDICTED: uncharacterized protein LOC105567491 [Vollenhovia emeryi]
MPIHSSFYLPRSSALHKLGLFLHPLITSSSPTASSLRPASHTLYIILLYCRSKRRQRYPADNELQRTALDAHVRRCVIFPVTELRAGKKAEFRSCGVEIEREKRRDKKERRRREEKEREGKKKR